MEQPIIIPDSNSTVRVRAIDTTTTMVCDSSAFIRPVIQGHERLNFKTMCFLVENESKSRRILFDCGGRKDFWNASPNTRNMIGTYVPSLRVEKGVDEILTEVGFDLQSIDAIVWSHWHWDHIGDASKFPPQTDIVVGPGFKSNFLPGYPDNPEAFMLSSDTSGHFVDEITFRDDLRIGKFRAHDYFRDGSFYILDVPGHTIGHICGLARTTPDTFVFMGGDCCHFLGAFRPSDAVPLPDIIPQVQLDSTIPAPCPCSFFTACHPSTTKNENGTVNDHEARRSPFYKVTQSETSAYTDQQQSQESIDYLRVFDASPDILICLAHDNTLLDVFPLLATSPERNINDWKVKGYKERTRWAFLNELPRDGKPGRAPLVSGQWKNGKRISLRDDSYFHEVV
ncbi:hypothetical protein COCC4DRAFT_24734 [Bipolaris maydis ATCC 48331]|uniref:Metallo-beta-lactamase domain-containing protein n=2 Tax=Cochliobolus heterostrophus TaxID=5016 RepID=M2VAP8_COCH5|nr:uncharacterized protein COCC4DRAFT_24734 [Bipolaris maydis ATCC 48331]EMD96768.1 hypothetical protein COCHEDRAFT_67427 [Bipolaris maydis C5]KAJ5031349.1 beta-lactamase-like protein [Bipolaris maydis]ENI03635.1 hypothetical protein COCC4DRAFT_24734 [Bipolaris maydis ATCC 48331]KAJ5060601.1 beta-lactamase-like protein [Bipolaris maydis]KAJ6201574.1 beta-lactamase-like protein [Bipolaris maydis]